MSIAAATRLLIIRHGETAWNAERRIQGHTDIPLNDTGPQQARALAEALTDSPIHAVYSSDLQRAEETGRIIAASHDAKVITTPQLRERHFGHIEGKTFIDFEVHFPEESLRWRKRDPNWAPPGGGESLAQLRDRAALEARRRHAQAALQRTPRVVPEIVVVARIDRLDQPLDLAIVAVYFGIHTRTSESRRSTSSGLAM